MEKIMSQVKRFIQDEQGATAVEYGLMVALIAAVVITGASYLGNETNKTFSYVGDKINAVNN